MCITQYVIYAIMIHFFMMYENSLHTAKSFNLFMCSSNQHFIKYSNIHFVSSYICEHTEILKGQEMK